MKKMKSKLFAAVAMLTVSAVALSTASYAWFTMQKEASVSGLNMTATAPSSLEISTASATTGFSNIVEFNTQTNKPFVPVSGPNYGTATPSLFYATSNTQDGAVESTTNTSFTAVNKTGSEQVEYYVDIPVYFRSTSLADNKKLELHVKSLNITAYSDIDSHSLGNAYKMAILSSTNDSKGIFANEGTAAWKSVATATTISTSPVTLAKKFDSASQTGTAIGEISERAVDGNGANVLTATLRIWLEGQDAACINANAGKNVKVNMAFEAVEKDKA